MSQSHPFRMKYKISTLTIKHTIITQPPFPHILFRIIRALIYFIKEFEIIKLLNNFHFISQASKLFPQPQLPFELGFLKVKPPPIKPSIQSITVSSKYWYDIGSQITLIPSNSEISSIS